MSVSQSSILTILAVDDSKVMQGLVQQALGKEYRVLVADNAVDALSTIYHEAVSVLLLDVAMPGIDGTELCRTVRSIPQFQNLPIIMLTSRDGAFDKVQGRLAGAVNISLNPLMLKSYRKLLVKFCNYSKLILKVIPTKH